MNIPQELIDKIIDGVWDADDSPTHSTTRAASLISRSWVERSQHHLFHDIEFSFFGPYFARWCDAVSPDPDGVSRHVRSLTIQARDEDGWWIGQETLERNLHFFDSFRNVQILRVRDWDVDPFPPEMLTRCFTSFAGSVRVLQWDPYMNTPHEPWTRIVGLLPLIDCLLLRPTSFPTGLLSNTPAGPTRKKLILSSFCVTQLLAWSECNIRFREIYIRCSTGTVPQTFISIINGNADWLEVLSIASARRAAINAKNARLLPPLLTGCHALRELSIDWFPVNFTPELHLIDAIPGGRIQSLRIMPNRMLWQNMWGGDFSDVESSNLMPPYERLAQAILRLGMRYPGRKLPVWLVVPQVPYVICDPVRECVVALWEKVEGAVSFGFQMTETERRNIDKRHPITNLA